MRNSNLSEMIRMTREGTLGGFGRISASLHLSNRPALQTVLTLVVLIGAALIGFATSESRAEDGPTKVRELYVPFRDLEPLLRGQQGRVFLERTEYERLLAKAKKSPEEKAPEAFAVTHADYVTTIGDGRARIVGTITIDVLADGLQAVPLEFKKAQVRAGMLDGQLAPLGDPGPGQLQVFVSGKGRHTLVLDLDATVESSAALQTLAARGPLPASTRMSVVVPGNVEVKAGAAVIRREVDVAAGVTRFELLPNRGDEPLVLTLNNRQLLQQRLLLARSVLVDEVTRGYERLHAIVSYQVVHGAVDRLQLKVPAGFEVTEVKTPLLSRWSVSEGRQLEVVLSEPVRDGLLLEVVATKTPSQPTEWSFPKLEPLEVAGHTAVVGVLAEQPWQLQNVQTQGLVPIDVSVLAAAIPASVATADGSAPPVRPIVAFYAPQAEFSLQSFFYLPSAQLRATSNLQLRVEPQKWTLTGSLGLVPEVDRLFAFDFTAPKEWRIEKVTDAEGRALRFDVSAAEEGRQRVHVTFANGIAVNSAAKVQFVAERNPPGWLGTWPAATFGLEFPSFRVHGATREDGVISVQPDAEFRVTPGAADVFQGLTPLDANEKPRFGLQEGDAEFAYRYEAQPYAARFDIERVTARMTARTHSFWKLDSETLAAHYEARFEIQEGKTSRLFVELPAETPMSLVIRGLSGTNVKEFGSEPVPAAAKDAAAKDDAPASGAMRRWWVQLAEPATSEARIAVDFTAPLTANSESRLRLPVLRVAPETVSYQSGLVAVEGHADLDVQVTVDGEGPGRPRRVDVGELATAEYTVGKRLLGAYGFIGESPDVRAEVNRRPTHELPAALVQRAELITLVGTNGKAVTVARYSLRIKTAFLELRLPTGAALWGAQLDGQAIAPQRGTEGEPSVLVSIPAGPLVQRDLQVVYEQSIPSMDWRGKVTAPAPQLWLRDEQGQSVAQVLEADVVWRVRLPSGYRVAVRGGTVFPDESDPATAQLFALRASPWTQVATVAGDLSRQWDVRRPLSLSSQLRESVALTYMADGAATVQGGMDYSTSPPDKFDVPLEAADVSGISPKGVPPTSGPVPSNTGEHLSQAVPSDARKDLAAAKNAAREFQEKRRKAARLNAGGMPGMPGAGMPGGSGLAGPGNPAGGAMGGGGMGGGFGGPGQAPGGGPGMGFGAGVEGRSDGASPRFRAPQEEKLADLTKEDAAKKEDLPAVVDAETSVDYQMAYDVAGRAKGKAARDGSLWALEGIRSLPIDMGWFQETTTGDVLTLRSLGHDAQLDLTLVHQPRLLALAWGAALLVGVWGVLRTKLTWRQKLTWLVLGAVLVTAVPLVAPWNHELGTVLDHVFVALLAVAVWYVAAAVGSKLAKSGHFQPQPSVKLEAATPPGVIARVVPWLIIVGVWAATNGAPVAAQTPPPVKSPDKSASDLPWLEEIERLAAPSPPIEVPDDVVVIPYDHEDAGGVAKATRMLVPYQKYVELWNLAYPDQRLTDTPLPAPFAWAGAEYGVELRSGDDVQFTGKLRLQVFSDRPIEVPLGLQNAVFTSVTVDGKPGQIRVVAPNVPTNDKGQVAKGKAVALVPIVVLSTSGKGTKTVEVTVRMKQVSRGGLRVIQGQVPATAANVMRVRVPDAKTELALHVGADLVRTETKEAAETIETALNPHGVVQISWRPKVATGEIDRSLTTSSDAEIDVREDALRVVWRMALEFRGGQRESFAFVVPPGFLVERVAGDNVRSWQARNDDAGGRVDVTLLKPATDRESLTIVLSRRVNSLVGEEGGLSLPRVAAEGAALQQGTLVVRKSPLLDVRIENVRGLARAELPAQSLSETLQLAEVSPLGLRNVEALRFQSGSYDAKLEVRAATARTSAEVRSLLKVDARQATLESLIVFRSQNRPVYQVRIDLPTGVELEQVTGPAPMEWSVRGAEGGRELTLLLGAGRQGEFEISIRGRLPWQAGQPLAIPRLAVRDVDQQEGDLVVQVDPSVDVRPEQLQGCEPVLLSRTFGWLKDAQRTLARLALHHRSSVYSGQLTFAARQSRVTNFAVTNVRVTGRSIAETVMIEWKIEEAGVRELAFTLPAALREARISAPLLRRRRMETVEVDGEPRVRVVLELQDEVMGQYRVLIEHDRLLTTERQTASLPVVETGRTEERYVTFESTARDELVVEKDAGAEAITRQQQAWARLSTIFGAGLLEAYQAKADATRLTYHTKPRSAVETVGARIALSDTDLLIDANGAYRGRQTYHVDNGTEQYLVIELPKGAALWTATVAGEPVRPQQMPDGGNPQQVRIPLVKTATGDLDYPVALVYGGKLPSLDTWSQVRFPFLKTKNINVESSRVRLRLPKSHRWMQFEGSMGRVQAAAEYEASWLEYQTRRFQRLLDTISSKESDDLTRMRSHYALGQLGDLLRQYKSADTSLSGNAEWSRNRSQLDSAFKQAQQVDGTEGQQAAQEGVDNRVRLNDLFLEQGNKRARNVATQLGANFSAMPNESAREASGANGRFDVEWFKANGFQASAPMNRVIMNESRERSAAGDSNDSKPGSKAKANELGQQSAVEQIDALRSELGRGNRAQGGQGRGDESSPANGQPAQQAMQQPRRGKRSGDEDEVKQRYQTQLESQNGAVQGFDNRGMFNDMFGRDKSSSGVAARPATTAPMAPSPTNAPQGTFGERAAIPENKSIIVDGMSSLSADGEQAFLSSLQVDLPEGGAEYLFRTPRGELEMTAFCLSETAVERAGRLAIVLVVGLIVLVPLRRRSRSI